MQKPRLKMKTEEFDIVILGTGLQQCLLAERLSSEGLRILQIDKNKSYGSDLRTMNYIDLVSKCKQAVNEELAQHNRYFNIDITPKFLLADGLVKDLIVQHDLQHLISFIDITGHFVFKKNGLHLIPHNEKDSLMSGLISLMQKPKVAKFFWSVRKYSQRKEENIRECSQVKETKFISKEDLSQSNLRRTTIQNEQMNQEIEQVLENLSLSEESMSKNSYKFHSSDMHTEFKHFSLNKDSIDLIGHAIALNLDDSYLQRHPDYTYNKIYLYIKSLVSLNGIKTPFIYPLYGISELCQAFSRRAGMAGCTFMLNTPVLYIKNNIDSIFYLESSNFNQEVVLNSTETQEENAKKQKTFKFDVLIQDNINKEQRLIRTNKIISELAYFPSYSVKSYEIITAVFIISGKIPLIHKKFKEMPSAHVLFLSHDLDRKNDIFMAVLSEREQAAPPDFHVCILTTKRETQLEPIKEIQGCISMLGNIVGQFIWCRNFCVSNLKDEDIIMVGDVDETTHLESIYEDYLRCERSALNRNK